MLTEHYLRAGIAAQALTGLLTAPDGPTTFDGCVKAAVDYSDALIAEVEKRHPIENDPGANAPTFDPDEDLFTAPTTGDLDRH